MKVALCTPCHGDPKAEFMLSLARLINFTKTNIPPLELEIFLARSANIFQSRQWLVDWARDWGADYMLWMDADHVLHPGSLVKLLNRQVDVVGAIFRRRQPEIMPNAARLTKAGWVPILPTAAKAKADEMEEVDRLGLGLVLMRMDALAKAEGPLFGVPGPDAGEDVNLSDRLRAAGVKIHVDHQISMLSGHIAETALRFPPTTIAVPIAAE